MNSTEMPAEPQTITLSAFAHGSNSGEFMIRAAGIVTPTCATASAIRRCAAAKRVGDWQTLCGLGDAPRRSG